VPFNAPEKSTDRGDHDIIDDWILTSASRALEQALAQ